MGNSNSTVNFEHNVVTADYQLLGKFNTIRWGELFEMTNTKTNQPTLVQEKYAVDLETYQKIAEDCTYRICLVHKNLAQIYGLAGGETIHGANKTYKVCIFFEHVSNNLQKIVKSRRGPPAFSDVRGSFKSNSPFRYFEESELLSFLSQLVDVLSFLQQNGISQRDITPDVCFITKDGTLKMLDKKLIFNDTPAFEMAREGNSNIFLTPAELDALSKDLSAPVENKYKADVFRVGMTLLECATLQRSSQIYDWNNQTVNLDVLSTRLIEVRERYSPAFYDPLREMLRFEENKRPDFLVLKRFLKEEAQKNANEAIQPRNSVSAMGPKLVTHSSPKPKLNDRISIQNVPGANVPTFTLNISPASKPNGRSSSQSSQVKKQVPRSYREEESETNFTELEDGMMVNEVPFTEARNSFGVPKSNECSPQKRLQNLIGTTKDEKAKDDIQDTATPRLSIETEQSRTPLSRQGSGKKLTFSKDGYFQNPLTPSTQGSKKEFSFNNISSSRQQLGGSNTQAPLVRRGSSKSIFPPTPTSSHSARLNNVGNFSVISDHDKNASFQQSTLQLRRPDPESKFPFTTSSHPVRISLFEKNPSLQSLDKEKDKDKPVVTISIKDLMDTSEYYSAMSHITSVVTTPKVSARSINNVPRKQSIENNNNAGFRKESFDRPNISTKSRNQSGFYSVQASPSRTENINSLNGTLRNSHVQRETLTGNKRPNPEETQKAPVDNELVESILKRMLDSAGISPSKSFAKRSTDSVAPSNYPTPQKEIKLFQANSYVQKEDRQSLEREQSFTRSRLGNLYQSITASQDPWKEKSWSATQPVGGRLGFSDIREVERPTREVLSSSGFVGSFTPGYTPYKGYEHLLSSTISTPTQVRKDFQFEGPGVIKNVESLIKERQNLNLKNSNVPRDSVDSLTVDVEDRFEMAMRRSQKSKQVMRGLADKVNRSSVRSSSNDPVGGRRNSGSLMSNGFILSKVDASKLQA